MLSFIKKLFDSSNKYLKKAKVTSTKIEKLEEEMQRLKDEDFPKETEKLKQRFQEGASLDSLLVEAYALAREASRRVTGLTPYYVQLLGSIVLHQGQIAEMKTGEGKTLTSVLPAYLNALSGNSVHIVTVNEYLASREAEGKIGDIFRFLGMTVGLNTKDKTIPEKQLAYQADILYSTNSELGFDYLRDNMETDINNLMMHRDYNYVIIDEIDSILIDEARTPLIISSNTQQGKKFYRDADRFVKSLKPEHYMIDLESKTIELTEEGVRKAEAFFQLTNLYNNSHSLLLHHIKNSLKAGFIMEKNKDYLVDKGQVLIIDQFTGRILNGRQFSDGLHQAIEAKEGCVIKEETEVSATITYQNFFRIYRKMSGMTGTAKTEEKEFVNIYKMKVVEIPTNKPMIREDAPDYVFASAEKKWQALLGEIEKRHARQQPILIIGTSTVEVSEEISKYLKKRKIKHEVLNAKNHSKEAEIIAKAGHKGSITIATNMAGRGTDIRLGEGVVELGGLAVLGTERNEARRIDNQLRGRAGRQGDPGFSRFFVSADDDLVKRFGSNRMQRIIAMLQNNSDSDEPITLKMFSNFVTNIQKKIESSNYDYRKFVLQFDSVLRLQREIIYQQRKEILKSEEVDVLAVNLMNKTLNSNIDYFLKNKMTNKDDEGIKEFITYLETLFFLPNTFTVQDFQTQEEPRSLLTSKEIEEVVQKKVTTFLEEQKAKLQVIDDKQYFYVLRYIMLQKIDSYFKRHINDMNILRRGINFLSYGQQNSLVVYQEEGQKFFNQMIENIALDVTKTILKSSTLTDQLVESFQEKLIFNRPVSKNNTAKRKNRKVRGSRKPWN
ncbi:Preprotein translocase secA subunit [Candidatus Phytoplasma pruni]|uniref:Protein translocase subunit SecA n=5 Tax=Candidatus Phytoplasma TaxID=33926 RepID=A0A0M1N113_9MOLU|nr:preprotein translocase subunit SecA [Candidatus Phytoplasma pruni]KOR75664.1 Preprotein translocase secA subunit [Candidatus Phytoplasma pruni]MCQ9618603.1 Preprotein translocase subunit SecA [Candidatus Phytoplasma pruni]